MSCSLGVCSEWQDIVFSSWRGLTFAFCKTLPSLLWSVLRSELASPFYLWLHFNALHLVWTHYATYPVCRALTLGQRSNFTAAFLSEPYTAPNFSPPDKVYDPLSAFAHFAYLSWRIFWSSISCISSLLNPPQFPSLFSRHLQKQWGWGWHCDRWHLFDYIPGRRVVEATPLRATTSMFTLGG